MGKQSGLGDNFYVGGLNVSGSVSALGRIGGGPAPLDVTTIDQSAYDRIGGLRGGSMEFTTVFDDAPGRGHAALSTLPTADVVLTYCRGTAIGNAAACMVAKQLNYDMTRGNDGMLTFACSAEANGYGLEWGKQLTAGMRTDTSATSPATGLDTGASASFGGQAYLQVSAFTGTSVTVTIQDSADNTTFANVAGLSFTAVTAAPAAQRIQVGNTATIRRYVRAITTGTFTNAVFSVVLVKNETAGQVF